MNSMVFNRAAPLSGPTTRADGRRLPLAPGLDRSPPRAHARGLALPLLAAAALALAASCGSKPPGAAGLPTRAVKTVPAATGTVVDAVEVVGELQGIHEVRVFAQVPERIRSLAVREGDRVKKGDVLAVLQADAHSEAVNQAQAALEAALTARDAAEDHLKRTRALRESGVVSAAQLESAEAQARSAQAQVRQATAAVAQASVQRGRTVVRSPIDGVVAAITLREGDLASGQPILTVVHPDRLKAVLRVAERDFLRLRPGMTARVSALARPEVAVEAKLTLVSPVVDRMTRTGLVEIEIDNTQGTLPAGAACRAVVELARREGAVLVPAPAVQLSLDTERTREARLFVADGKTARERKVRIGARQGDLLEITEGLAPGEPVIVEGAHLLRDGNPIEVAEARP